MKKVTARQLLYKYVIYDDYMLSYLLNEILLNKKMRHI